ncbi:MAG: amidohydrolase [Gammaproteobacteria bacterium]|nr:amidohydrolase [Gammaproteobacteria bacterium]
MLDLKITNARLVDGTGAPERDANVGIVDGRITEVGEVTGKATRTIDAAGRLVTPGFVDIHTHYDGQVCWDKQVTPSCWHGVTSVVMGNCGVGFAPVHPGDESRLVSLMESVEDIPGSALHTGIPWGWESFAEYLDTIDTPYTLDVGTQVPHAAIRRYVMGDRCYDDATDADMQSMASLTGDALRAGALGFSTSRFYGHVDVDGNLIPGTLAQAREMTTIASAFERLDHGTIEIISDHLNEDDELAWIESIMRQTGRTVTTLAGANSGRIWEFAERVAGDGLSIRPQVGARPASILMSLDGTINPMKIFPTYREIMREPLEDQIALLHDAAFRERIKADTPIKYRNADARRFTTSYGEMFPLDDALTYEPGPNDSIEGIARRSGKHHLDVLMDTMADRRPVIFFFGGYPGNLERQRSAIDDPRSVFGLSDGGAHCGVLCDASVPTYMLAYFTRDRERGDKLPLPLVVHKMTQDSAGVYGLTDRGLVAPGYLADLNVIDYDALALEPPAMVYDLPGEGKRLIQKARGYAATIKRGKVTFENGEATGEMPGGLIRGGAFA